MLGKGLRKLLNMYEIQSKYSNSASIVLNELKRKNSYVVEVQNKKFLIRKNRGDLGVLDEIYHRGDYNGFNFERFDKIVDVGAHIGGFCIKFSEDVQNIYSYEPNSQTYDILKKNLKLNKAKNIEISKKAVSSEGGETKFYSNSNSLRSSTTIIEDEKSSETVEKTSLKSIVDDKHLEGDSLLKLDCEGSEFEIIENTDAEVLKKFDAVFLEWHAPAGNPENLRQELEEVDFEIEENTEERDINNNVGFIYAKSYSL